MTLRDFKGMSFTLDAQGGDIDVFGANATGKTTLADAFAWLLFDKDSLGRSDFEIKNINPDGEHEHYLEHSVEAVLEVATFEGMPSGPALGDHTVTLKKVFKENWTKKRGSATATFTGHSTDYYIDGVPVQLKEYKSRISDIAGEESVFRLLTSPTTFPALHWQKQRALLLEVCGDMTDADVIASDSELAPLAAMLGKRTIDDHRKVLTAKRTEINKELEKVPVRIDEQRRSLPDVAGLVRPVIDSEVATLAKSVADLTLQLQGTDTGGALADLSKRLSVVNADILNIEAKHRADTMKTAGGLHQKAMEATNRAKDHRNRIASIDSTLIHKKNTIEHAERNLSEQRRIWTEIDADAFQDTTESACASCGQALPEDRVHAAREKAIAAFNLSKSNRLAETERAGKNLAAEKALATEEIGNLMAERAILSSALTQIEAEAQELTSQYEKWTEAAVDVSLHPMHGHLAAERIRLEDELRKEREGRAADSVMVRNALSVAQAKLSTGKELADRFVRRESGEKRIEELKAEEKKLAAEFERIENELFLCDQFIRAKVRLLTDRINSRFETVKFKLFSEQINGGLSECCEITVGGVPFGGGLNNAGRINAGLDVCRTLSAHYGLVAPVFVDNAESVCRLISMDAQVIRLVVSAQDSVLRAERVKDAVAFA